MIVDRIDMKIVEPLDPAVFDNIEHPPLDDPLVLHSRIAAFFGPSYFTSWPLGCIPAERNVFGNSPSPASVNFLNRLYHMPDGTSGSGFQPVLQFSEVVYRNSALPKTLQQMIHDPLRRRPPDFRHS